MNSFSNRKPTKSFILTLSIGLFIVSLFQQCFCTSFGCAYSIAVLFSGSFAFYLCNAGLVWLANPLLLISWIQFNKNHKFSLITSFVAMIISLSFLFFSKIIDNEAGVYSAILSYKLGYWLWLSSSLTMFIGNGIMMLGGLSSG